jgi:hypothetical protein
MLDDGDEKSASRDSVSILSVPNENQNGSTERRAPSSCYRSILFLTFISLIFPFSCDSKQHHAYRTFLPSDARRILGVASFLQSDEYGSDYDYYFCQKIDPEDDELPDRLPRYKLCSVPEPLLKYVHILSVTSNVNDPQLAYLLYRQWVPLIPAIHRRSIVTPTCRRS